MTHASLGLGWQIAGGAIAFAVTGYTMLPALLPMYTRRYNERINPNTFLPEDVDEHTLGLVESVLTKLKMPQSKEESLDVFVTSGIATHYSGSFGQRTPCLLGLPRNFKWTSEEHFQQEKSDIIKRNFPWEHPSAAAVKASLLLTDEEKEFVIAQQLGYLDTQHDWMKLGTRMFCLVGAFLAGHITNVRLGSLQGEVGHGRAVSGSRPAKLAGCVYGLYLLAGFGLSTIVTDFCNCQLDIYADRYAGTISPEFSRAGVDYYNKILNANRALREIFPDGERRFTTFGNEVPGIIRMKKTPFVSRRDYLSRLHEKQLEAGASTSPSLHDKQQSGLDFFSMNKKADN